jgi:hypothetical protein
MTDQELETALRPANSDMQLATVETSDNSENEGLKVESSILTGNKTRRQPPEAFIRQMWKPGQSGNPAGRPTKARELAILDAISNAFTPEQVTEHLRQAMDIAIAGKSPRSIVAVLEFMADRTAGKPTVRIEQSNDGLQGILAVLDGR